MVRRRSAALVAALGIAAIIYSVHRSGSDQPVRAAPVAVSAGQTDMDLIAGVLSRVKRGEPYYEADTAELAARGYSLSSFLNWRLPTLAILEAALPSLVIAQVLLALAGIAAA